VEPLFVGFKAGGPESIALKKYSEFVEYGDIDALEECILQWINKKNELGEELERVATTHYSKRNMAERYLTIYEKFN